ncbi:MAG: tRNA pseudouridine(55) synthase TruB [Pirellulaceae bacterium]
MFGFLNCNKPAGMTSRDVVNVVQRRLKRDKIKVGHCGTLDPLAEGVLLLGVGPAVRLTSFVQDQPKHYVGKFRLGASSETGDLEDGFATHDELPVPTREQLESACEELTGQIEQVPPAYSAIWIDGQRAYDRVRRGEVVDMPTRQVMIHQLALADFDFPSMTLDTLCGSGTYIRTLGIDVARAVGSMAVMTHLVRTAIGDFQIDDTVSIDQLRDDALEPLLKPASMAVSHLPRLVVNAEGAQRLKNGLCVEGDPSGEVPEGGDLAAFTQSGILCAILRRKPRGWCPYRGFPVADDD